MLAVWEPRRSSCMSWPADVSNILMRVPCRSTNEQRHIHKTRAGLQVFFFFYSQSCCWSVRLTLSDAVAILVPCRFKAMQHSTPSCARMSTGGFSVLAKSTIWTWPEWVPGKASRELLLLGHSTQRPTEKNQANSSNLWLKKQSFRTFFMLTDPLGCSRSRTHAADEGCGWRWRLWSLSLGLLQF